MNLNWVDIAALGILAGSAVGGVLRGLVRELASLLACGLGLLAALRYHPALAREMAPALGDGQPARIVAFLLIAAIIWGALELAGVLIARTLDATGIRWMDRVAGGGFGILRGFLVVGVMLVLAEMYLPSLHAPVSQSALGRPIMSAVRTLGIRVWHEVDARERWVSGVASR